MPKVASAVILSEPDRNQLESWVRAQFTPQQVALRSRIILMAAAGKQDLEIADELNVNRHTPALWRKRFQTQGLDGVWEIQPGRGRKPSHDEAKVAAIVAATLQTKPKGSTHWSCRTMARAQKVSPSTINRVWQEHNLKPHRTRSFKLSRDVKFLEKLTDVVGLYLNPPDKSAVLCLDEKSQIQALDRTQPGLPLKKGRCGTMTHDYVRHGTTTLFAALNMLDGTVIGSCFDRHRHEEFLKFLRQVDRDTPEGMDLHLIVDNYSTHKHPKVKQWLKKHGRFHLHFIPTSSSWLNLVERWFGEITRKQIRRGIFKSVKELIEAIDLYVKTNNQKPKPFVWTKRVDEILEKVNHCKASTVTAH